MSDISTVSREMMADILRKLRLEAGLSQQDAADELDVSKHTISKIELGRVGVTPRNAHALLMLYGVTSEEATRLTGYEPPELRKRYAQAVPGWFAAHLEYEAQAWQMKGFQRDVVPGLFQTPPYAEAMALGSPDNPAPDALVKARVQLRIERQRRVFAREVPLHIVIDESALRRRVVTGRDAENQIEHLVRLATRPSVTLQVLPFSAGVVGGMDGSFTLFWLTDPLIMVSDHRLDGAKYLDQPEQANMYRRWFAALSNAALNPDDSVQMMAGMRRIL